MKATEAMAGTVSGDLLQRCPSVWGQVGLVAFRFHAFQDELEQVGGLDASRWTASAADSDQTIDDVGAYDSLDPPTLKVVVRYAGHTVPKG